MTGPDVVEIAPSLFRVRIHGGPAHLLNAYLWVGDDGVTLVDTGWESSAPVLEAALASVGRRREDVRRIVLTHFHDDHAGAAAQVAAWSGAEVVAGRADADVVEGLRPGPLPVLTAKERELHPGGDVAPQGPPCRVHRRVDDGDVLDLAGGTRVLAAPGHTPGSIALHLRTPDALLVGDVAASHDGAVILGVFHTDRAEARRSLDRLAGTGATTIGFGHGEAVHGPDAALLLRGAPDPFADDPA